MYRYWVIILTFLIVPIAYAEQKIIEEDDIEMQLQQLLSGENTINDVSKIPGLVPKKVEKKPQEPVKDHTPKLVKPSFSEQMKKIYNKKFLEETIKENSLLDQLEKQNLYADDIKKNIEHDILNKKEENNRNQFEQLDQLVNQIERFDINNPTKITIKNQETNFKEKSSLNSGIIISPKEVVQQLQEDGNSHGETVKKVINRNYLARNPTKTFKSGDLNYFVNPYDIWKDSVMFNKNDIKKLQQAFEDFLRMKANNKVQITDSTKPSPGVSNNNKTQEEIVKINYKLQLSSILYFNDKVWSVWLNNKKYSVNDPSRNNDYFHIVKVNNNFVQLSVRIKPHYILPNDLLGNMEKIPTGKQVKYDERGQEAQVILYPNQYFSSKFMAVKENEQ